MRWGVTGITIAHSGFKALNDYREKPDIFGRKLKVTQTNIMDGLASSAVLAMGEGKEQTPLALLEDIPFVRFHARNPSQRELKDLHISVEDDLYAPLLQSAKWKQGRGGKRIRVVVFGIFDALHEGHKFFLERASFFGEELIVVVGRDKTSSLLKRKTPRHTERDRLRTLQKHLVVSKAVLGDRGQSSWGILKKLKPDVICIGHDQKELEASLREWIIQHKKRMLLFHIPRLAKVRSS